MMSSTWFLPASWHFLPIAINSLPRATLLTHQRAVSQLKENSIILEVEAKHKVQVFIFLEWLKKLMRRKFICDFFLMLEWYVQFSAQINKSQFLAGFCNFWKKNKEREQKFGRGGLFSFFEIQKFAWNWLSMQKLNRHMPCWNMAKIGQMW